MMEQCDKPTCAACGQRGARVFAGSRDFFCGAEGVYDYLRCPRCQLTWVSPQPTPRRLQALYEAHYGEVLEAPSLEGTRGGIKTALRRAVLSRAGYPAALPARAAGLPLSLIRPVADRATYNLGLLFPPFRPGGRLLDIGCGHGWYVRIMRDWGWDAIGVEADGGAAARGRAAYGVDIRPGSLEEQRFPDGAFDAVSIRHVFEHVPDPAATLREIRRVLRPGGWLGMAMPNGRSLGSRWFGRAWRGFSPPWHLHLFSPTSLSRILVDSGFRVRRVRTRPASAHWVYTASREIRDGVYDPSRQPPSAWWFHYLEQGLNYLTGDLGEELEAVAERPDAA